jgi:uncharacterized protein YyaL (SSP411 family)
MAFGGSRMAPHANREVNWLTFSEAFRLAAINKKPILVDVYTKWCGWCKVMDQKTYSDQDVVFMMNDNFFCVRFDAETGDTILFKGMKFTRPAGKRTHSLAQALLDGKLSYPTTVILNEKGEILSPIPGYLDVPLMKKVLHFFGKGVYKKMSWEEYEKQG